LHNPELGESRKTVWALGAMLLAGLLIRLAFIGADGFRNDVVTFEAWALTLASNPMRDFFAKAGFADYPPGYMYVLWFVGHLYKLLIHSDPGYGILKIFVKLPGILMDLVDAVLIFAIVRRFSTIAWAFGASAFFLFNPCTIFISAFWGQVDSVSAGLALGAILLVFDAYTKTGRPATMALAGAWVLVAASILIKPPAVVLVPLLIAFPFATDDRTGCGSRRLIASLFGAAGGLLLAYVAAVGFHPALNPFDELAWLYGRYQSASSVYAYNSVNAFNLYAMVHHFWDSDSQLLLGLHQYVWGVLLFLAATALVVSRYIQTREPAAFLEAAMVLSLGYFVLLTRMHERYIFDAFAFVIPLIALRRRYLWAAVILSITLLANLFYSLYYLHVMNDKIPNVDALDLAPYVSHPMSFLNVAVFFYLGFVFLGADSDALERFDLAGLWQKLGVRHWFAPAEGLSAMVRLDWLIAATMSIFSFVLTFANYRVPTEKIFDEIYYARAGEEYLAHKDIFEFTHPPLTKLIITLSIWLFGGLQHGGDTSAGWRFLNLVVGAVMVLAIYVFAKRLLGSTLFASIAAGFLLFDGFHYVQSRIATPEITVALFSLLTLYAFYRFWIASQIRVARLVRFSERAAFPLTEILGMGTCTVVAFALGYLTARSWGGGWFLATWIVAFLYFECAFYVLVRILAPRLRPFVVSFAEGSRSVDGVLETFDGGIVSKGSLTPGESTTREKNGLDYADEQMHIEYPKTGDITYKTPDGDAAFAAAGTMRVGDAVVDGRRDSVIWLGVLAVFGGCLAASKWNGLFDFFVVWFWVAIVVAQPHWVPIRRQIARFKAMVAKWISSDWKAPLFTLRPAHWGNPFGFSIDVIVATMLVIGATIYLATYIPYLITVKDATGMPEHHNLGDLISLQQQMYQYHAGLKATHPYGSSWWQWPFILRPISYYYHDFRTGAATQDGAACCVAEILALPNPAIWWLGLISVPFIAYLAIRERHKGFAMLVTAYFFQWLPWIISPRVAFEYHFLPNLAVICMADAALLQRIWNRARGDDNPWAWPKLVVYGFCVLALLTFVFFFPILAGTHITWQEWDARMLHWLFQHNEWV
jgi:dolichyl-phosphate-mannose--protein O-mannosyl transferase